MINSLPPEFQTSPIIRMQTGMKSQRESLQNQEISEESCVDMMLGITKCWQLFCYQCLAALKRSQMTKILY